MTARTGGNVLMVYALHQHPVRATITDHLEAFQRYSPGRVFPLNLQVQKIPSWLDRVDFDLVVFHTTFLSCRWAPELFARLAEAARPLRALSTTFVALPQDEFLHADILSAFIEDFGIDWVFTVAPESEIPTIYRDVDRDRVRFHRVLTGYLERETLRRIDRIVAETRDRPIDVGYRAWQGAPWLGRHGTLKGGLAAAVNDAAPRTGLTVDVSTDEADTLLGDDWYRFLARCRATIGIEGGASILDHDGSLKAATERYLAEHPGAGFDEVEASCFPGRDGELRLFALSPRHLEACATRTAQLLVRGEYNGILEPERHYVELEPDLSNLDAALERVRTGDGLDDMIEASYRDVVASGRFTYESFVAEVEITALDGRRPVRAPSRELDRLHRRALAAERASKVGIRLRIALGPAAARARESVLVAGTRVLPRPARRLLRRLAVRVRGAG